MPSFMRIGQKMWMFYKWPIFECISFFIPQALLQAQYQLIKQIDYLSRLTFWKGSKFSKMTAQFSLYSNLVSNTEWQLLTMQWEYQQI